MSFLCSACEEEEDEEEEEEEEEWWWCLCPRGFPGAVTVSARQQKSEAVEAAEVVKLVYHGVCLRCHGRQAGVGWRLLLARDVLDVKSLAPRSECLGNRGLMQSAPVALHQVFI
ncbi:unnamed protein product [Gadus morhua 'NCC']